MENYLSVHPIFYTYGNSHTLPSCRDSPHVSCALSFCSGELMPADGMHNGATVLEDSPTALMVLIFQIMCHVEQWASYHLTVCILVLVHSEGICVCVYPKCYPVF